MRRTLKKLSMGGVVVALALSACASDEDVTPAEADAAADDGAETDDEGSQAAEPGGEATVVELWSTAWFPSSIEGRVDVVDRFNAEHEGEIFIEYVQGDWGQGETYVQSGVAAGQGLACIVEWEVGQDQGGGAHDWYRKDWIQDLSPYVTDERRALMDEAQWESRTFNDGAIVATGTVLWEPSILAFYNPEHLEAAGIEPASVEDPWTWDEWYQNAETLTDADEDKWGYALRLDPDKAWFYGMSFAQQKMGQPIIREEDGVMGWYLDDPDAIAAYDAFLSTMDRGVTPEWAIGIDGDSLYQSFIDGKVSMIIYESFANKIMSDSNPDFEFGVMPPPEESGDFHPYIAGGEGMVMTKTCDTPEEAAEFMFWMMEAENLAPYAHANAMIPANLDALEEEPFSSDPAWEPIRERMERADPFAFQWTPKLVEFQDTVGAPALMEVIEGKRTFQEVNAELHEKSLELLNE